jgi:uncharacterized protein YjbI with pentapeptide repeats
MGRTGMALSLRSVETGRKDLPRQARRLYLVRRCLGLSRREVGSRVDIVERIRSGLLTGEWIDLNSSDGPFRAEEAADRPERVAIDGRVLRQLVTEPLESGLKRVALRLRGAVISGDCDWSWQTLDCPVEFKDSIFQVLWSLENAHLLGLTLTDCLLSSIEGSQLVLDGALVMESSKVRGTIWLPDASVAGPVHLAGLDVAGTDVWFGHRAALVAPRMKVGGVFRLDETSRIDGLMSLRGAQLGGGFIAVNCRLDAGAGIALDLRGANVSGDAVLSHGFKSRGAVRLDNSVVAGAVACHDSLMRCPQGDALSMDGAHVASSVFLRQGFRAIGRVRCIGIQVAGNFECTGGRFVNPHGEDALWANNATIEGSLFLRDGCRIRGRVRMIGTRIGRSLDASDCVITNPEGLAILARNGDIGGNLQFRRARVSGRIDLSASTINGSVDLCGVRITRTTRRGALVLDGSTINGSVTIEAAPSGQPTTDGQLSPSVTPLIVGRIDAGNAAIQGRLTIGDLVLNGAAPLDGRSSGEREPRRVALLARGLRVAGAVAVEGNGLIQGELDLSAADLGALHVRAGTHLRAPAGDALRITSAEIRSGLVLDCGLDVAGTLRMTAAHVRGNLTLTGTSWRKPRAHALISAQAAVIDGETELQHLDLRGGTLGFRGATLQGTVNMRGATLNNPTALAADLHQTHIAGELIAQDARITGCFLMSRAVITGRLTLRGTTLTCHQASDRNTGGFALNADSAEALGSADLHWAKVSGPVSLDGLTTTALSDDPDSWPPRTVLTGFSYQRFQRSGDTADIRLWDVAARLRWLDQMPAHEPGPYEQLARVFRAHGLLADSERILMESQRRGMAAERRLENVTSAGETWRRLLGISARQLVGALVGYGYRPARALIVLAALVLIVAGTLLAPPVQELMRANDGNGGIYSVKGRLAQPDHTQAARTPTLSASPANPARTRATSPAERCGNGAVPCFNAIYYAIDTVIPLVNLKQRDAWYPEASTTAGQALLAWLNLTTLIGWFLSSVFVFAFTKVVRTSA